MEEGLACLGIVNLLFVKADFIKKFLNHTLHGVEISLPVHPQGELHPLIRKLCQRKLLCHINISQLIETDIFISPIVVGCQRGQHPVQGGSPHNAEILS